MASTSKRHRKRLIIKKRSERPANLSLKVYLILGLVGLLLSAGGIWYIIYSRGVLSFSEIPVEYYIPSPQPAVPVSITFPDINLEVPVRENEIKDGIWQISESGASHLSVSAYPGQTGNIIIYGHNKTAIFGRIRQLKTGYLILLATDKGNYTYIIDEILSVTPEELDVIRPTRTETLTVYTCTGFLDSKRFVVRAHPQVILPVNPRP